MTRKPPSGNERFDIRVNSESKALFLKAAKLSGQDLSTFIVESVHQRAVRILKDYGKIRLNNAARDSFLDALAKPPAPGDALRRAAEKHTLKS